VSSSFAVISKDVNPPPIKIYNVKDYDSDEQPKRMGNSNSGSIGACVGRYNSRYSQLDRKGAIDAIMIPKSTKLK
jgi:hypothetical protein